MEAMEFASTATSEVIGPMVVLFVLGSNFVFPTLLFLKYISKYHVHYCSCHILLRVFLVS